jgi:osmoprotectant transport system ATP-binding protein
VLAQFDPPDAVLAHPASEFVEHFVGADRGLKRLSLARVRDLQLAQPVIVRPSESRADARRRLEASTEGIDGFALLVDGEDRPLGWIDARDLDGEGPIDPANATPGAPTVQPETTLRDALSAMLLSSVQLGVVVDEHERVLGVIRVDAISDALRGPVERTSAGRKPA